MKTVLRHRRQASIKTRSGHKSPAGTKHKCHLELRPKVKVVAATSKRAAFSNLEEERGWCDSPQGTWYCSRCPWRDFPAPLHTLSSAQDWRCAVGAGTVIWRDTHKKNKTYNMDITATSPQVNIITRRYSGNDRSCGMSKYKVFLTVQGSTGKKTSVSFSVTWFENDKCVFRAEGRFYSDVPWHSSKNDKIGLLLVVSNDSILHVTIKPMGKKKKKSAQIRCSSSSSILNVGFTL